MTSITKMAFSFKNSKTMYFSKALLESMDKKEFSFFNVSLTNNVFTVSQNTEGKANRLIVDGRIYGIINNYSIQEMLSKPNRIWTMRITDLYAEHPAFKNDYECSEVWVSNIFKFAIKLPSETVKRKDSHVASKKVVKSVTVPVINHKDLPFVTAYPDNGGVYFSKNAVEILTKNVTSGFVEIFGLNGKITVVEVDDESKATLKVSDLVAKPKVNIILDKLNAKKGQYIFDLQPSNDQMTFVFA